MWTTSVTGHLLIGSHSEKASAKFSFLSLCVKGARSPPPLSFPCIYSWPQCVPWELIKTNLPVARPPVMGSGASLHKVTCLNRDSRGAAWKVFPLEGLSLTCSRSPLESELPALVLSSRALIRWPISLAVKKSKVPNPGSSRPQAADKAHFRL